MRIRIRSSNFITSNTYKRLWQKKTIVLTFSNNWKHLFSWPRKKLQNRSVWIRILIERNDMLQGIVININQQLIDEGRFCLKINIHFFNFSSIISGIYSINRTSVKIRVNKILYPGMCYAISYVNCVKQYLFAQEREREYLYVFVIIFRL
jgi:hypothetical protein